jgi:hypothetical protein
MIGVELVWYGISGNGRDSRTKICSSVIHFGTRLTQAMSLD